MSDSFKVKKSDVVARMVKLAIDDEFEELSNLSDSLSEYNEFYHTVTLSAFYQEELSHWVRTYGEPIRDEPAPDGDRLSGYRIDSIIVDDPLKGEIDSQKKNSTISQSQEYLRELYPKPGFDAWISKGPSQLFGLDREPKRTMSGTALQKSQDSITEKQELYSNSYAKLFSGFDSDWQFAIPKPPDTEPGLGDNVSTKTDDSNKRTGCSCAECKAFNEYGEPNQPNGQYVCYACRENLAWKYR